MRKSILAALLSVFWSMAFCQEQPTVKELLKKAASAGEEEKIEIYKRVAFFYLPGPHFDSALYCYELCLDIARKTGNEKEVANAYNNTGLVLRVQAKHEQATEALFKALALYEKNGMTAETSKALVNLSFIYKEQGNLEEAIKKVTQALEKSRQVKDTITLINLYGELADDYNRMDNVKQAAIAVNTGKIILDDKAGWQPNNPMDSMRLIYTRSFFNNVMALVRSKEGRFAEAEVLYRRQWEDSKVYNGSDVNKYDILLGMSSNFYRAGKYDSALHYSEMALGVIKENSMPAADLNLFTLRADIFEKLGRYKDAYNAQNLANKADDSLKNEKAARNLAQAQAKYETEKKDIQITALHKEKKLQKFIIGLVAGAFLFALGFMLVVYRSRKLQKKLFEQREVLLIKEREIEINLLGKKMTELEQMALRAQMNPHFIFNSLNTVQHFIMNKDVEGVNKYLATFAHLVRQTLNNSGHEVIALDDEVKYLETYLSLEKMKSDDRFSYAIEVGETIDQSATFIPG
ncbi:MAG: histidine kinase, partial [Chitinophagaceae bacterium]|nr:histidine kinase [Chitinophagaceae bacterium]